MNPTGREGRLATDRESVVQFENRKVDHIRLALSEKNQASGLSGLETVQLIHEALPDLDFEQIQIATKSLKQKVLTPFLVSSMTGGHKDSAKINRLLATVCADRDWRMGVGSQRRELNDHEAGNEWREIRRSVKKVRLLGNLGLSQLVNTKVSAVERLVDSLQAEAMIIHLNPLQECLQPEGTPRFKGGLKALERLCKELSVPVVVKETGCGFSKMTLKRLKSAGVAAVDISGLGGTHWGRIEGDRSQNTDVRHDAAVTFRDWGVSTVEAMAAAIQIKPNYEIWGSGGVRTGLDAAKLLAMGATTVGMAAPVLTAAMQGEQELQKKMATIEFELKTALFCTGSQDIRSLQKNKVWRWQTK